jgi:aminoglycoside N3'-acetyltransferase
MFHRLRRRITRDINRFFYRIDRRTLGRCLGRLGLKGGSVVCVHSALSRLGHLDGGTPMIVRGLMETVGEEGCLLMPSYPSRSSMLSCLESGDVFDVRSSPSRVGALTETFRRTPGVVRSLHPTNPLTAWGALSDELLQHHEKSPTPYGSATPYGRLAERDDSYILMLGTPILSLLHHLQERVEFPNLFLDDDREAAFIDETGRRGVMTTRVMRPRVPYYVAVPSSSGAEPDWAILHDFCLVFPRAREPRLAANGYRFSGYPTILNRSRVLEEAGVLRSVRLGRGEAGLLHVRGFLERVEPEMRELIDRFRGFYDPEKIASLGLPYF